jgi:hypothetical protein
MRGDMSSSTSHQVNWLLRILYNYGACLCVWIWHCKYRVNSFTVSTGSICSQTPTLLSVGDCDAANIVDTVLCCNYVHGTKLHESNLAEILTKFWNFHEFLPISANICNLCQAIAGSGSDTTWDFLIWDISNRSTNFYQYPEFLLISANFYEFLRFLSSNFNGSGSGHNLRFSHSRHCQQVYRLLPISRISVNPC